MILLPMTSGPNSPDPSPLDYQVWGSAGVLLTSSNWSQKQFPSVTMHITLKTMILGATKLFVLSAAGQLRRHHELERRATEHRKCSWNIRIRQLVCRETSLDCFLGSWVTVVFQS